MTSTHGTEEHPDENEAEEACAEFLESLCKNSDFPAALPQRVRELIEKHRPPVRPVADLCWQMSGQLEGNLDDGSCWPVSGIDVYTRVTKIDVCQDPSGANPGGKSLHLVSQLLQDIHDKIEHVILHDNYGEAMIDRAEPVSWFEGKRLTPCELIYQVSKMPRTDNAVLVTHPDHWNLVREDDAPRVSHGSGDVMASYWIPVVGTDFIPEVHRHKAFIIYRKGSILVSGDECFYASRSNGLASWHFTAHTRIAFGIARPGFRPVGPQAPVQFIHLSHSQ